MTNVPDCGLEVNEFEIYWHNYVHFSPNILWKDRNPLISSVVGKIVPLLFFYNEGFSIKVATLYEMLLDKETKSKPSNQVTRIFLSILPLPKNAVVWFVVILFICLLSYLPTSPLGQDMTQGQFFKRSLTGLNSEFSFS